MSEEKLYRVEELSTNDWHLVNDRATNMTKQQCDAMIRECLDNGIAPSRLRVRIEGGSVASDW